MDLKNFEVSWVDFAIVIMLLVGVVRGRRRGISQELLDVLKWLVVVVVAGHFYEPIGEFFAVNSMFSLLTCYVAAYSLLGLVVLLGFSVFRRMVGQKLMGSDLFGSGEYYLGMLAGFIRYACIVLVVLAFVNARYYAPEELRKAAQYQNDVFGSEFFPTFGELRKNVVEHSMFGRLTTDYLSVVMIRPTSPNEKPLVNDGNIVRARERQVKEALEGK